MRWSDGKKGKGAFTKKKILHVLKILFAVALSLILLLLLGTVAHASGLVDDTVSPDITCIQISLIQLSVDFTLIIAGTGFRGNWLDGIGKSVQYGLYCITNFIWTISLYLSNATGYVVSKPELDFINDMADSIGQSKVLTVNEHGFLRRDFMSALCFSLSL